MGNRGIYESLDTRRMDYDFESCGHQWGQLEPGRAERWRPVRRAPTSRSTRLDPHYVVNEILPALVSGTNVDPRIEYSFLFCSQFPSRSRLRCGSAGPIDTALRGCNLLSLAGLVGTFGSVTITADHVTSRRRDRYVGRYRFCDSRRQFPPDSKAFYIVAPYQWGR